MSPEQTGPGRWVGIPVVMLGLLLAGWFFFDFVLDQYQSAHTTMVSLAALGCLVAVVATLVALAGVWSTTSLWVAAAGFGSAALLSLLAHLLLIIGSSGWSWDLLLDAKLIAGFLLVTIPSLVSLALALVCARLARTARWRRWL